MRFIAGDLVVNFRGDGHDHARLAAAKAKRERKAAKRLIQAARQTKAAG